METTQEEIYSKVLRAGRRTYFFDVRETKASDYYLTITESKKFSNDDGTFFYKKHKIYLYKEDFSDFKEMLSEVMDFIINERGIEVINLSPMFIADDNSFFVVPTHFRSLKSPAKSFDRTAIFPPMSSPGATNRGKDISRLTGS